MKISLIGFILNDPKIRNKLAKILTDNDQPVPADIALDYLIQEYVKLRLGGTSKVVGESRFPCREFELTIPNNGAAVEAQQARQDHLDERYHQDGRHERSHPMHGLYTGLVQHTPTTQEDPMSEFLFFSLTKEKIAIRKSSIHALFPSSSGSTVVEYGGDSVIVRETFDEVCIMLGVAVPQQEQS